MFVDNIPDGVSAEELTRSFRNCGHVSKVWLFKAKGQERCESGPLGDDFFDNDRSRQIRKLHKGKYTDPLLLEFIDNRDEDDDEYEYDDFEIDVGYPSTTNKRSQTGVAATNSHSHTHHEGAAAPAAAGGEDDDDNEEEETIDGRLPSSSPSSASISVSLKRKPDGASVAVAAVNGRHSLSSQKNAKEKEEQSSRGKVVKVFYLLLFNFISI